MPFLDSPSRPKVSKPAGNPDHALGRHAVTNGLLEVDLTLPADKHPILQLIEDAQNEWDAKVARQSKTLAEAVAEYGRRNKGRKPPKGFDHWWNYVQSVIKLTRIPSSNGSAPKLTRVSTSALCYVQGQRRLPAGRV